MIHIQQKCVCMYNLSNYNNILFRIYSRFKNRPHMTFDDVTVPADQEFEMQPDINGSLEYSTKYVCVFMFYYCR